MVDNPYELKVASPHEAGVRMRALRSDNYTLPPAGSGHHHDRRHAARQGRIATLLVVLVGILPFVWFFGWYQRWWGHS